MSELAVDSRVSEIEAEKKRQKEFHKAVEKDNGGNSSVQAKTKNQPQEKKGFQSDAARDKQREIWQARKMETAMDPASIVISPKTPEADMLTQILINFDKALNHMHLRAGTYISMPKVLEMQKEIINSFEKLDELMEGLSPLYQTLSSGLSSQLYDADSSIDSKKRLASANFSWVFVPKTMEGNKLARAIKMMDSQLVSLKTTCSDFTKIEAIITGAVDVIKSFYEMTEKLAKLTEVELRYKRKGRINMVIGREVQEEATGA